MTETDIKTVERILVTINDHSMIGEHHDDFQVAVATYRAHVRRALTLFRGGRDAALLYLIKSDMYYTPHPDGNTQDHTQAKWLEFDTAAVFCSKYPDVYALADVNGWIINLGVPIVSDECSVEVQTFEGETFVEKADELDWSLGDALCDIELFRLQG